MNKEQPWTLIAEEDEDLCEILVNVFAPHFATSVVHTCNDAELLLKEGKPTAVLMSDSLPDKSIVECVKMIRSGDEGGYIAVFGSFLSLPNKGNIIAAGADIFLIKPFTIEELEGVMRSALDRMDVGRESSM